MPLQATSGAASYDAFGGGVAAVPNYIEEVFGTFLYTGNGSTQTITNGIDLAGEGGLVWTKRRDNVSFHGFFDTIRGATNYISSNNTDAQATNATTLTAFNSNGFSLGADANVNRNTNTFASWTFRKQEKFFDVVTWTGNSATRTISHSLGAAPGCIIIKRTSTSGTDWIVYHRSLGATQAIFLDTTAAAFSAAYFNNTSPTSTEFTVNANQAVNNSGDTYVAYLFAHDAGGFGLTGTDNVISCGSYTGNGSGTGPVVTLGYEPQWLMIKNATTAGDGWVMFDNMRGMPVGSADALLLANTSGAETSGERLSPTATGFQITSTVSSMNDSGSTYIYIAIRRGPMKVPTSGTSVFQPVAYTGTNVDNRLVDTGIVTDMTMARIRTATSGGGFYTADRLRGDYYLSTATTGAQATDPDTFMTPTVGYGNSFSAMNGFGVGNDVNAQLNQSSTDQLAYAFRRSPNFFDEVFYTGTGISGQTFNHNLGAVPDLMIVKLTGISSTGWMVYVSALTNASTSYLVLNSANTVVTGNTNVWNSTAPTSSVFTLGANSNVNFTGDKYVAYLFASCPNVSKVGSYTGTGATLNIDCGFTSGARFVLIKRTDSSASWLVWDTARGMVAGTDPSLALNSTSIESNANSVYTISGGFQIVSTSTAINASGGNYIFLAIA